MSPTELLVLALMISIGATGCIGVLALARHLGVAMSQSWTAKGWPLLGLISVACVAGATLPLAMSLAALVLGVTNGGAVVLWTWLALRKFRE